MLERGRNQATGNKKTLQAYSFLLQKFPSRTVVEYIQLCLAFSSIISIMVNKTQAGRLTKTQNKVIFSSATTAHLLDEQH